MLYVFNLAMAIYPASYRIWVKYPYTPKIQQITRRGTRGAAKTYYLEPTTLSFTSPGRMTNMFGEFCYQATTITNTPISTTD
jgi:hypothetical protein